LKRCKTMSARSNMTSYREAPGYSARNDINGMNGDGGGGGGTPGFTGRVEDDDGDLPLELEHMLGFTGARLGTLLSHPTMSDVFIKSMGSAIVVGDLNDPHQQEFLRGHDMEVSTLSISPSGRMLASGQLGTIHRKGYGAPIIIWDMYTKTPMFTLQGHTERVELVRFSPDERFLAAAGADQLIHIWDMQTGEIIFGKKFQYNVSFFQWCETSTSSRRRTYEVALGSSNEITVNTLSFDATRQQWQLVPVLMSMPTSGMVREYLCSTRSCDGDELLSGTSMGDLVIFKLSSKVYRASVPVCSNGLQSVLAVPSSEEGISNGSENSNGSVFCGGGDGSVRKLIGDDLRWTLVAEAFVEGAVSSLSLISGGKEILIGTNLGRIYRMNASSLACTLIAIGHTNRVCCVAFGDRSDIFASGTVAGNLKVWDLSDYGVISETTIVAAETTECGVTSLCWLRDDAVVSGWKDRTIRCFDASTMRKSWDIASAHRAPITSVACHLGSDSSFVCSGAEDGTVRVWALKSREMMIQFAEHQRAVTSLLVDVLNPALIHSSSMDCQVLTYDLKRERRTVGHQERSGAFMSMSQRVDSEQELVTCDFNGRLLFWDCDVAEPVQVLQSPNRMRMRCVCVSPTGRYLAVCGDAVISIFDVSSGVRLMAQGHGHSEPANAIKWSPDEKQVVSVGEDCCVCVWNFYGTV